VALAACGTTEASEAGPSGGDPAAPPSSTPGAVDPGPGPDPGPTPTPDPKPDCSRKAQAKTAPVTLWDDFQKDAAALNGAALASRIDKLLADVAARGGAPLEDPAGDRVVFLARGTSPSGSWKAIGGFVAWDTSKAVTLAQVGGSDLYAGEAKIARGQSHDYKLLVAANDAGYREDPLARNVRWDGINRGLGKKGEFNGVVHPQDLPKEQGRLVSLGKVHSTNLANDREVWVHYPARYDDGKCEKLPSIVFHDGMESLTRGAFAVVADALYAQKPELSAVLAFVGLPTQEVRMQEYTFGTGDAKGALYVDFLATELLPKLAKENRLCSKAGARGISGASLGGLISTFAAFEEPTTWGWVGAQSSSYFWDGDAMLTRVESTAKIDVRFYLDSGCPNDNCAVTDEMDAIMTTKGYDHVRIKDDGAQHDWSFWNERLPGMLTHFRDGQTVCD
jgi:enterochelin esterase family protein